MISTILIFVIILGLLVFVHEFGHFIVAKKSGMQVEEFGFGFPPRLFGVQRVYGKWKFVWGRKPAVDPNKTIYSINTIPLGGFVRILGENNEHENNPKSFINKGFWPRFFTLVAGVLMNVLLAWVLLSSGFLVGLPAAIESSADLPKNAVFSQGQVTVLQVVAASPAELAGIKANDVLLAVDGSHLTEVPDIRTYIKDNAGKEIVFAIKRGQENISLKAIPSKERSEQEGALGIDLALVGRLKYPFFSSIVEGGRATLNGLEGIVVGLYSLIATNAGFSALGGPVQIAKLTGEVAGMGFIYLIQFTSFLSLNLAVLNILPFPALDGGRVLFLVIEKIRGKRNNQKVEQVFNTLGFLFLLLLMVAVTINDITRK